MWCLGVVLVSWGGLKVLLFFLLLTEHPCNTWVGFDLDDFFGVICPSTTVSMKAKSGLSWWLRCIRSQEDDLTCSSLKHLGLIHFFLRHEIPNYGVLTLASPFP